ncbi:MAG: 50S ribosomal protein L29 [Candidatus Spechtbacterales bacterium]
MKIKELRQKSDKELEKMLQDKKARIVELKMNIASGNVKNVKEMRGVKKDIARILTIFEEKKAKSENNDKE